MTVERDVEIIRARVDEHGRLITQHGEALEGLMLVVYGDTGKQITGLLQRTGKLEGITTEIQLWRRDMMIYARAGLAILGVTSIGTWLPYIRELLAFLGG